MKCIGCVAMTAALLGVTASFNQVFNELSCNFDMRPFNMEGAPQEADLPFQIVIIPDTYVYGVQTKVELMSEVPLYTAAIEAKLKGKRDRLGTFSTNNNRPGKLLDCGGVEASVITTAKATPSEGNIFTVYWLPDDVLAEMTSDVDIRVSVVTNETTWWKTSLVLKPGQKLTTPVATQETTAPSSLTSDMTSPSISDTEPVSPDVIDTEREASSDSAGLCLHDMIFYIAIIVTLNVE